MEMPLPTSLQEAVRSLIDNLLASETFIRYQAAQQRMNDDPDARDLLRELSQAQAGMRRAQASGSVRQAEVNILREVQLRVYDSQAIMDYTHCQQAAIGFLREINAEVSSLLGVNFASFANHSTC